jgi:glycosyltransferase involved in cell wall biosynthesis
LIVWGHTRRLSQLGIEVLHVHGIRPLTASRRLPVPVVFTNHSSGFLKRVAKGARQQRRMNDRMAHLCHVLAPSRELAEKTREVGFAGPVDYIPNGVDIAKFQSGPSDSQAEWQVPANTPVMLLARRLVEKNGVTVFANSLTHLTDLPWVAVFAGDGSERANVEQILARGGIADRCRLLGNVPNSKMLPIYRAADISVLPSFMEATSITGLESMATGLPLVGTNVGGIPELIQAGETGLLVPPGNPIALANALRSLLVDRELRFRMGQAGRQRAVNYFSWDSIAAQTVEIYARHLVPAKAAA